MLIESKKIRALLKKFNWPRVLIQNITNVYEVLLKWDYTLGCTKYCQGWRNNIIL